MCQIIATFWITFGVILGSILGLQLAPKWGQKQDQKKLEIVVLWCPRRGRGAGTPPQMANLGPLGEIKRGKPRHGKPDLTALTPLPGQGLADYLRPRSPRWEL